MSSAIDELLPFDHLNINIFGDMNRMLESLLFNCLNFNELKISHNFGGGYQFVVKFASFLGGGGGGAEVGGGLHECLHIIEYIRRKCQA